MITKREWIWASCLAVGVAFLAFLPYWIGYIFVADGRFFTGLLMNPEDSQTYLAKMWQGYNGTWRYTIPFTTEAHEGELVGLFYTALGNLTRWLGLQVETMWHLARGVADVVLFLVVFGFIGAFVPNRTHRWTAYLLALFGSGLGWLLFLFNQPFWLGAFPVDFKQPGAHLFFSAFTFPHVALGTAFTIGSVWCIWLLGQTTTNKRMVGLVGLTAVLHLLLGIAYPFLIYLSALIAFLWGMYLVWRAKRILWREGIAMSLTFILPAPLFLYYAQILQRNEVFRAWDLQAGTPSYPLPHYLIAYGLMLLLGWLHWRKAEQPEREKLVILWIWVTAVALLLYAPLRPQRRFVQGVHLPLAIVATLGWWQAVWPRIQQMGWFQRLITRPRYSTQGMARLLTLAFVGFMSLSNLYVIGSTMMSSTIQQPDPLFRDVAELETAVWLRENSPADAVVMGSYQTGSLVAGQGAGRVIVGHWAETMNFPEKLATVQQFYAPQTSHTQRLAILQTYEVDYVWVSGREVANPQANGWWTEADYLQEVLTLKDIRLYAVR